MITVRAGVLDFLSDILSGELISLTDTHITGTMILSIHPTGTGDGIILITTALIGQVTIMDIMTVITGTVDIIRDLNLITVQDLMARADPCLPTAIHITEIQLLSPLLLIRLMEEEPV